MQAETDHRTDEELARSARAGSCDCFEQLVRRYEAPLLRFLRRHSPNFRDAEDMLQESFLRVYQSLHLYDDLYPFKPWLFKVSYNLAVSLSRKRTGVAIQLLDKQESESDAPSPLDQAESEEAHRHLWDTAGRLLTPEQFTALWLHYADSMETQEVAEVLGRSREWVKTALHRSRKKLLVALESPVAAGGER